MLNIPTIALAPIVGALESAGLLLPTEKEDLLPGREMARIKLQEILDVVRIEGETGSHQDPQWSTIVDVLGTALDAAAERTLGDRTLSDLLDESDEKNN